MRLLMITGQIARETRSGCKAAARRHSELPRRTMVVIALIMCASATSPSAVAARVPNQPSRHSEPWVAFPEFPPGATRQELYVDSSRGPVYMYVRFIAGYALPYHWHSATLRVYVEQGLLEIRFRNPTTKLTAQPGTVVLIARRRLHSVRCTSADDCFFYLSSSGRFDVHWLPGQTQP
jgi:hypothetical protein